MSNLLGGQQKKKNGWNGSVMVFWRDTFFFIKDLFKNKTNKQNTNLWQTKN